MSEALADPNPRQLRQREGGKPDKLVRDALILDLHRWAHSKRGKTRRLYVVAAKLVDLAIEGDLGAIKEIMDRVDGRVPQEQRIAGADGGAILMQLEDTRPSIEAAVFGMMTRGVVTDVDTPTIEHTPDASGAKPDKGEIT